MGSPSPRPDRRRSAWALVITLALWGVGALGGGFFLARWPDGSGIGFDLSLLAGTPFADFLLPGLILFTVGLGAVTSAVILAHAQRRRRALDPRIAWTILVVALGVNAWIIGEIAFLWGAVRDLPEADRRFFAAFWGVYLPLSLVIGVLAARVTRPHLTKD